MKLQELLEARILPTEPPAPPDYTPTKWSKKEHKKWSSSYSPHATGPDSDGQELTKKQLTEIRKKHREIAKQLERDGLEVSTRRRNSELHRGRHYYAGSSGLFVNIGHRNNENEAQQIAYALAKQYNIPYDWNWLGDYEGGNRWEPSIRVNQKKDGSWYASFSVRERGKRVFGF